MYNPIIWHPRGMGDLLAPHPGFAVLICAKMNLKSMNYFLRYAEEQPECSGNLHHPQCCPHHEDA